MNQLHSQILPGLFMGGTADRDVVQFGNDGVYAITTQEYDTVVTMYAFANPADWNVREYRYGVYDSVIKDLNVEKLLTIVELAYADWKKGQRVLIRCQAGLNRSGLVTALVLMKDGLSAQEAINLIRKQRDPDALFNNHYVNWLLNR